MNNLCQTNILERMYTTLFLFVYINLYTWDGSFTKLVKLSCLVEYPVYPKLVSDLQNQLVLILTKLFSDSKMNN